jgi:hypothetical protein
MDNLLLAGSNQGQVFNFRGVPGLYIHTTKIAQLRAENLARTTLGLSPVSLRTFPDLSVSDKDEKFGGIGT